jgi:Ca-activated chloride channel family protein
VESFSLTVDLADAGAGRIRAGLGATVEGTDVRLRRVDFRPRADFWLELADDPTEPLQLRAYQARHVAPRRAPDAPAPADEASERDYVIVPLVLPIDLAAEGDRAPAGLDLVVVADVSAATDPSHLELGQGVVEAIATHLGPDDRIAVVASDLALRSVVEEDGGGRLGPASPERLERLLSGLARVPAGGATDLGTAITAAGDLLDPARRGAVVYVGDGAPTVGELQTEDLLERMARLPAPARLYAVAVGGAANLDLLSALCRGRGLAARVEERRAAADVALRVLAHLSRPVAQEVTVHFGGGVENVYPSGPADVALGDVLPVLGRVAGGVPASVRVTGTVGGRAFDQTVELETETIEDSGDLRIRWAGERLRNLLLEGVPRETIVELGTRYGLITPYTSFYVPSASELRRSGLSQLLLYEPLEPAARPRRADRLAEDALAALLAAPLALAGCRGSDESAPAASQAPAPFVAAKTATSESLAHAPMEEQSRAAEGAAQGLPGTTSPTANQALPAVSSVDMPALPPGVVPVQAAPAEPADPGAATAPAAAPPPPPAPGGSGASRYGIMGPADASEEVARRTTQPATKSVGGRDLGRIRGRAPSVASNRDEETERVDPFGDEAGAAIDVAEERRPREEPRPAAEPAPAPEAPAPGAHQLATCSPAASLSIGDRRALWRERLERDESPSAWVGVYRRAIRDCEAATWRERRALLDLMVERAGSVSSLVDVYRLLASSGAGPYLRQALLGRVRTPSDLVPVRAALGGPEVEWRLVDEQLAGAETADLRLALLRDLVTRYPGSHDLKLRLLAALERAGRLPEALRLARQLRGDRLADAEVRTSLGELLLRHGQEQEARRVFSEMVEFAPYDALARRRLGDLYRAHGWFDDAYRQYQTLAEIRPDDLTVQLLLAAAAAGAGRVDEALRLERSLAESPEPDATGGLARVAVFTSSARLAKLRRAAREEHDEAQLRALTARMRRSAVLRSASALRVTLLWAHPHAGLSLWSSHPNLALSRPPDVWPDLGVEVFDVEDLEDGTYRIEVRREAIDRSTPVEAELVLLWNEGQDDEQILVVPIRFEGDARVLSWTIAGRQLAEAAAEPGTTAEEVL